MKFLNKPGILTYGVLAYRISTMPETRLVGEKDNEGDPNDPPLPGYIQRDLDVISEEAFRASETETVPNFAILVLAIGLWASRAYYPKEGEPTWAIEACRRFYQLSKNSTRMVASQTKGSAGQKDDGDILNLAASLLFDPEVRKECNCDTGQFGERQAIITAVCHLRHIAAGDLSKGEYNRLRYHWNADKDRRISMAVERFGSRSMRRRGL